MEKKVTTLHAAACSGKIKLVEKMLAEGADVNEINERKFTPLHCAAWVLYNEDMMEFLLKAGADVSIKNAEGQQAVPYCCFDGNILQKMIDHHGLDIHNIDSSGCTPLHTACQGSFSQFIKGLIKNGADANALDPDGRTPIMYVLGSSSPGYEHQTHRCPIDVLPFLLQYSDVNIIDKNGKNIFQVKEGMEGWLWSVETHLAKLYVLELFIHKSILNKLQNSGWFVRCVGELLKAKGTKFDNSWVSFLNLICDDKSKLIKYAGNRNIVRTFRKTKIVKMFPIYGSEIRKRFSKAIISRKVWDNAAITLSDLLPIFDPYHLIIRNILDCLSKKDWSKLLI